MLVNKLGLVCLLISSAAANGQNSSFDRPATAALICTHPPENDADYRHKREETTCFVKQCNDAVKEHIRHELDAAFSYLYMAAYFDDIAVARPGLAKFFYGAASEERQHAIQMLSYLDRRGAVYEENYRFNAFHMFPGQSKLGEIWQKEWKIAMPPTRPFGAYNGKKAWGEALESTWNTEWAKAGQFVQGMIPQDAGKKAWDKAWANGRIKYHDMYTKREEDGDSWKKTWMEVGMDSIDAVLDALLLQDERKFNIKYKEAIELALEMEMAVTQKITAVVEKCSQDFDAADFFTQPILGEQFDGQRKLSGALNALEDMMLGAPTNMEFAEYVFDQRVLKNGL